MPRVYLSPSTQEANLYVNGGTEEQVMNQLADALVPYLRASGIQVVRNTPQMTAASSIRQSNQGAYDLHLALHSNAAPESRYGQVQGSDIYYAPNSTRGKMAAEIIAKNLKDIYPYPSRVRALSTTSLGEVTRTRAPAVLVELAYHDNEADASWIKNNIPEIARNLALSVTEYFDLPLVEPQPEQTGTVRLNWGTLNLRQRPSQNSAIIANIPNNAQVRVLGKTGNWYVVNYNGNVGFASADYIRV